jgi:hypothetical protein
VRGDGGDVPGGLGRAHVGAIAEGGQHVARQGVGQFRVRPGGRGEPPVPFQPVRGAGQDAEQGPLGHPLAQRGLQGHRGLGGARRPVLFQAGAALVIDHQAGVVRVAGVGGGALDGQPCLQGLPEPARGGGQAGLGAEARQQLCAPGRADQLGGPLGIGVRPVDGDVAGAQLFGQVGEHAGLQVPADEHARMLAVPDRGIPVPRGEQGTEHLHPRPAVPIQQHGAVLVAEHHVVGDVVAGLPGVGAHVAQQVEHAGIGAGGLQAQRVSHGQHRRPVLAEMPGH